MKQKKNVLLVCLLLILPLVLSTLKINPVNAQSTTRFYIDPPEKIDLNLNVNDQFSVNVKVEDVQDLKLFRFEMTFNPDVIHGVWYDESEGYPVEIGPFLGSAGGTVTPLLGPGWNNTLGKLWLTGASLLFATAGTCPDGDGVLAIVTFEVVGKGETELRFQNAGLKDVNNNNIDITVEHGYFRNVNSALLPTASFTFTPAEPLEGYNTTFDGTSSTPASGRTLVTYKWYFWTKKVGRPLVPHEELDCPIVIGSVIDHNYTRRGTWPLTLTVIDDTGVVGTTTQNIVIKAHDVYFLGISTNATIGVYPNGPRADIGDILEVNATAINEGNYTETFDVSTFWSVFYENEGHYGLIGTQTGITLTAGQSKNVTFYWDTTGRERSQPETFTINANASRVAYEYDTERAPGKIADNQFIGPSVRVRFHDIRVKDVTCAESVRPGEILEVKVTVVNDGDYNETGISVTLYYGTTLIETKVIDYMENFSYGDYPRLKTWEWVAGGEWKGDPVPPFYWNTTGVAPGYYTIKANATLVPGDYEPHDNTDTKTVYIVIPGDFDRDGDVDPDDFVTFGGTYGTKEGDPYYNADCDFDGDGDVDPDDFVTFAGKYGTSV